MILYFVPHCSIVFRIPPSPFSQRELHFLPKPLSIVFTTPSVPLVGDRNLRRKDVTALLGTVYAPPVPPLREGPYPIPKP